METRSMKRRRMSLSTKITDLNDDCLIEIFAHLDFQSLLNVAFANEFLRPAARYTYKRKFGAIEVNIERWESIYVSHYRKGLNSIAVAGFKPCLQYLRCFGSTIRSLCINYNYFYTTRYNYVHRYINYYCAESLNLMKFHDMPNITINEFNQKKFINVRTIQLFGVI